MIMPAKICIVLNSKLHHQEKKAEFLSQKLALPIFRSFENSFEYHLVYTDFRLELQHNPYKSKKRENSVYVDFLHRGRINKRISSANIKDPLPKAAGVKAGVRPSVIDATAGYGTDGFVLAWLGCEVTLIERSPIIHALLIDGIERAKEDTILADIIEKNLSVALGDSLSMLKQNHFSAETIIVDPMYPTSAKGPLNKKEMRIIRQIVGDDTDNNCLLKISLKAASKRVAVKRPKGAAPLCSTPKPSFVVPMKSGRFDVYLRP